MYSNIHIHMNVSENIFQKKTGRIDHLYEKSLREDGSRPPRKH